MAVNLTLSKTPIGDTPTVVFSKKKKFLEQKLWRAEAAAAAETESEAGGTEAGAQAEAEVEVFIKSILKFCPWF